MATATLPLAELHCHLKGSITPAMARSLGAQYGIDMAGIIGADGRYAWSDFTGFLSAYDRVADTVRTPKDYHAIIRDYYRRAASEGLIYGEMFVSPAHAALHGLSYAHLIETVADAIRGVERDFGVIVRIIVICVRHFGVQGAEDIAASAQKTPHPTVVGFGMGGDELFGRPGDFARAFAMARDAGLMTTCHAGEIGGPDSVRATLRDLKVARLGHGVRAGEDPELLRELRDKGIFLEVCPGSNIALGLFADYAAHPLARFARDGLKLGISTDDPGFFGDSIGAEYARVAAANSLPPRRMLDFTRMSIDAAFCDAATKAALHARVAAWDKADPDDTIASQN